MIALLKKDFITSRKPLLIINIIAGLMLGLVTKYTRDALPMTYTVATLLVPVIVNRFTATSELRKNYDLIINSFPVKRRDVVLSKYIYYMIAYIISSIIMFSIVVTLGSLSKEELTTIFLIQSLTFIYYVLLIGATNYTYYKLEYSVAVKYSSIIMLSVFYLPYALIFAGKKFFPELSNNIINSIMSGSINRVTIVAFLAGVIIYAIFMLLSVGAYNKRDL